MAQQRGDILSADAVRGLMPSLETQDNEARVHVRRDRAVVRAALAQSYRALEWAAPELRREAARAGGQHCK